MKAKRTPILKNPGVQTLLASLLCIVLGLVAGYLVLLVINPAGAAEAITMIMKNYLKFTRQSTLLKNMGYTLTKTVPLLMCSLSVLFAYKVGLFNIGAAGQYVAGAGAALYCALGLHMPWYVCFIVAIIAGAMLGIISGALKAYFNVNEVISCIMLNWIMLYSVNMLLTPFAPAGMPETETLKKVNPGAILPSLGMSDVFGKTNYVTIALPLAVAVAIGVWVLLTKTKLGYELRATGLNKHAAKYSGMREKGNLMLAMAISGALAGAGAAMYYLTDYQQWGVTQSAVPGMGFNGIAAAFLGGLHPIGAIFSSYFIEHISGGGTFVDKTMYCAEISDLISAVIIYLCGFVLFFRGTMTKLIDRFAENRLAKAAAKAAVTESKEGENK
ncbi:MAG: ABC transporter permease [Clostridia bacterium]|nr:ABC transporter permease [Clostridia bacterium]